MKAQLILADAATVHPDGTTSILRAGIDRVFAREAPVHLRACLVARIVGEPSERGSHDIEISCIDEDGKDRLAPIKAQLTLPPGGGSHTIVLALQTRLNAVGLYQFNVLVDKVLLDTWNLRAELLSEKTNAENA